MTPATTTGLAPRAVGTPHVRLEGRDKVTGAARYAADFPADGLAHGWIVTSTVARGRIASVDDLPALKMPGVLAVLHHGNAPRLKEDFAGTFGPDATTQILQHDRVPHAGWPVACVVAETPEQAREAAETLVVTYDTEPHDVDFRPGHPAAYTPDASPAGPGRAEKGDVEAELAASDVVVDAHYSTPELYHNAMEPHAAMAYWDDGRLEVVDTTQGAYATAQDLAQLFGLDPASVHLRSEHVGGGFGSKAQVRAHLILAVMATNLLGRPVRIALTRPQMFSLIGHRSRTAQRVRLGAGTDGRLRALEHTALSATSTLREFVEPSAAYGRTMYDANGHRTVNNVLPLDVPTPTYMRAPGEAPGSFAMECALDELAERCGLDPIALRARNEPSVGPVSGLPYAGHRLLDCFAEGARRFGWAERDPRPGVRRDGRWLIGTGTAAASFFTGVFPVTAAVTANADGTFTVRITAADIGTGARTALTQLAVEALDVEPSRVRLLIADSDFGNAWLAGGSMGTRSWGWAIQLAARELRERLALGAAVPADGLTVRSDTEQAVRALAAAERHAYGAQFAEVAVDPGTGEIRVRRMLGIFAAGRIVNPLTARSQLTGGMIWGLSAALHEEGIRDAASGALVNADLAGYHYAAHADVPAIEADWLDDPDPDDPVGIKGIGEIGAVGSAAAVANAVWHATGVRHRDLPIRPDRVLIPEQERAGHS
ncbi:xanthine dehydrogenase family protein molybdopterin-binding subunit [Streptomyces morookaense]|uniref:Xanthine dehydrogenase family protein molybdopterin-binding subunit n=1 Tax=Streptomyces morookaense TaxID=1970 RepID=A0A7Y7B316_STRMO|nr:xanthine dehydrogenase family protein molybdopterin-binding subunit [Streptomyces morookaense]NVK77950.1 xanthine dehydrogenase family protein molybdopterin-binding subunit [Streptomyces morookaense]GHF21120.1 oxidoreductase [Streptomyces morookaense]